MSENISRPIPGITWSAAAEAAAAAIRHAEQNGWRINVAVVDRSGNLMAFLRMPEAFLHSIDIAIDKAYTAASFGMPTSGWPERLKNADPGVAEGMPLRPRLVAFGGGLPIRVNKECLGGIGVSGATATQDEECARAGLSALGL